ncbi:hypothetical protein [Enterococcus italicus]
MNDESFDHSLFEWVKDYYSFKHNKRKFVLFHYPILEWDGYYNRAIHLYGHVHDKRTKYFSVMLGINAVNVGADMIEYAPISVDEIENIVNDREMSW